MKGFDSHIGEIRPIFVETYGKENATKWIAHWRTFFIAVAEFFGLSKGQEYMVSHYLFKK